MQGFTVSNELDSPVTVRIEISVKESDETRVFVVELAAGKSEKFRDLSILEKPVTWTVTYDGESYEYKEYGSGVLRIEITEEGVEFIELVS